MRIEGTWRLAIYLGVGAALVGTSVGIGLSLSSSGRGTPRSAAGVTVPAAAATSQASAASSASPSASAAASASVVTSGGYAGTTTAPAPGYTVTAAPPPAPGPNPPPSPRPSCAPVMLDVSPVQVSIGMGGAPAMVVLTAECGAITWSAVAQAGVTLSAYGGTLQAGGMVNLVIQESSTPANVSYITINAGGAAINPGGNEVTVVNPWVPVPPPPGFG